MWVRSGRRTASAGTTVNTGSRHGQETPTRAGGVWIVTGGQAVYNKGVCQDYREVDLYTDAARKSDVDI